MLLALRESFIKLSFYPSPSPKNSVGMNTFFKRKVYGFFGIQPSLSNYFAVRAVGKLLTAWETFLTHDSYRANNDAGYFGRLRDNQLKLVVSQDFSKVDIQRNTPSANVVRTKDYQVENWLLSCGWVNMKGCCSIILSSFPFADDAVHSRDLRNSSSVDWAVERGDDNFNQLCFGVWSLFLVASGTEKCLEIIWSFEASMKVMLQEIFSLV